GKTEGCRRMGIAIRGDLVECATGEAWPWQMGMHFAKPQRQIRGWSPRGTLQPRQIAAQGLDAGCLHNPAMNGGEEVIPQVSHPALVTVRQKWSFKVAVSCVAVAIQGVLQGALASISSSRRKAKACACLSIAAVRYVNHEKSRC